MRSHAKDSSLLWMAKSIASDALIEGIRRLRIETAHSDYSDNDYLVLPASHDLHKKQSLTTACTALIPMLCLLEILINS